MHHVQKEENDGLLAEMRQIQEEQKRLHNSVRAAERDHRKAAQQLQHEIGKLDMRLAELDTARSAEDDLHQQNVQATQVTYPSVKRPARMVQNMQATRVTYPSITRVPIWRLLAHLLSFIS